MSNSEFEIYVGMRISEEQQLAISKSGQNKTDFIREAINEKIVREDKEFLNKQIRIKKEEIEKLENFKKIIQEKEEHKANIPSNELTWLLKTREIILQRPEFVVGRLKLYLNTFPKTFKVSQKEFLELLQEAENQYHEKKSIEVQK